MNTDVSYGKSDVIPQIHLVIVESDNDSHGVCDSSKLLNLLFSTILDIYKFIYIYIYKY